MLGGHAGHERHAVLITWRFRGTIRFPPPVNVPGETEQFL